MTKPLIQIDDEIREMTDEEYEVYLEEQKHVGASADIVD
jgi:ribosomal protein L29